ncbi:UDP-glycosyltransferase 83A1 [Citrus sinensis]|uniref:UDP-glycosyltransferase 83A1 n=1 Tax=Citrus sinensis TaxID=2711 RepID=A0ACB8LY26_CITSI|nr:UDP-glycosyltransferase 83A1 [Citrus sinensis]
MCREKQLAPAYIDDDGQEASSCSCNCKPCTRPCRAADEALTVDCSSGNQGHIFECSFHTCSSLGNCVIRKWQNTRLDFVSIPDGVDPQDGREERIQLSESMQRVMPRVPLKSGMIKISPKLPAMSTDEFIWSVPGDPIRRKILFGYISCAKKTLKICNWLLCSSFYELEPLACDSIPNVLPIGPLLWINRPGKAAASLWPEDSTCLKWLDKQPSQSVIYVAFGSIAIFSRCQFEEVALGLELAGRPFLWVVRPNLLDGSVIKYPDGFLERVPNQGMIIEWAPQEQVLAHRAVACFLSHCGWNSTIEGLSSAVPFLCWPYFADQFLISSYICDFWKVGLGLKQEANGNISRHEIKRNLDQLLSDSGIRENGLQIKEMAGKSLIERESSRKNFEIFIDQLKCII